MTYNQTGHENFILSLCNLMDAKSYLELGVFEGSTIRKVSYDIPTCKCVGVDTIIRGIPRCDNLILFECTTDSFFERYFSAGQGGRKYDVIFIDANHSYESVKKDLDNSLRVLSKHGVILLHDTHPAGEDWTFSGFCGDAYRIVDDLRKNPLLESITLPYHPGLTLVRPVPDSKVPWE